MTTTREVATVPPKYLYVEQIKPGVPAGVPADERTDYLLDAYVARGDTIDRCIIQSEGMAHWVREIQELYPEVIEKDFSEGEDAPEDPE